MPGVYQWTVERLPAEVEAVAGLGIPAVILFGIPEGKDPVGGLRLDGIVQGAIRSIKLRFPSCWWSRCLSVRVHRSRALRYPPTRAIRCLHPHLPEGYVLNDPTLEVLGGVAVSHAEAGADHRRQQHDGRHGRRNPLLAGRRPIRAHPILSYAVKYASAFYGPFRDAAESSRFGDRSRTRWTRPMLPGGAPGGRPGCGEGADMLMVKPALPYLDVIHRVRLHRGTAAFLAGEAARAQSRGCNGWIDERTAVLEALTGIKRAGADMILRIMPKMQPGGFAVRDP